MFDTLSKKFQDLFSGFTRSKTISEDNISEAVKEVRLALLEADVNYSVASSFVTKIKEKAIGADVIKSVSPKEQFIKIVHDELMDLMGKDEAYLNLENKPATIMLCGLQGSGKTTTSAKLAFYLKKKHKRVLLAACDLQRPAAIEQLKKLANDAQIDVFSISDEKKATKVAKKAYTKAKDEKYDVLIIDTAGRLHIDEVLMQELKDIKNIVEPNEVLYVANATFGQDAVKTAYEFDKKVSITGSILTMLDSDARAGAAISIREVTQKPLKFEATGERLEDFQIFNPESMADRILGMGDVINLVRKAKDVVDEEEAIKLEKKIKSKSFNYDDYLKQMSMMKKMGSMKSLLKMVPGMSALSDFDLPENEMKKIENIIKSMTKKERLERDDLCHSRRKRLASGSGTSVDDVNRLVKGFKRIKQFMKKMPTKGLAKGLFNMNKFGGNSWR
ncbi:MAG: Signal recognition particle protein [Candidatus Anoxychlamydiales bacterium]|nr:Signal recognition particle protein [Candidatus Anoxychlamydiales bacterium]NGX35785.1 Signal recognition particle protein [Candidatus Anoxychlamydiales bacterium]